VLSPSVRKLVAEKDLDPQAIAGSGKHGRILKTDVLDFLNTQAKDAPPAPTPAPAAETHSPLSATAVASLRP